MRFLTAVALALVMLWVPVDGVAQERGDPLRGITTVLPVVDLLMDEAVSPEVKEKYDQEIEDAFELGLLRAGLELTPRRGRTGIPPLLICDAMALIYVNRAQSIPLMSTLTEVKLKEYLVREDPYDPDVPPSMVPLPMLDPEPSVVPGVGAS